MPRAAGGGGGRIVINPADLRRGSKRLVGAGVDLKTLAGRLQSEPRPVMPADIAGDVTGVIQRVAQQLSRLIHPIQDSATELERRAFWAEIADQLAAGYPLSGAQLKQFMEGLRDQTLVRYAEPWQAELAGAYLASMYADNYKDPKKLIELAAILQQNQGTGESNGAFMAGFVDRFGTRMADIPRVIQAMEWTPGTSMGSSDDPMVDWELGRELFNDGYRLNVDPVELLGAFSMALALGTASGRVSKQVEHDIAWDEDHWAVAQLMHEGTFGANFLKEAFQSIVVSDIQRDAAQMGPDLTGYMAIGMGDNEGPSIPTDERRLVLDALLRNPEGAALALSTPLPEAVHIASRWDPVDTRDPIAVLYAADWDDDGQLFADVYRSAVGHAWSADGDVRTAHQLTQSLVDRTINAEHGWEPVTMALADDLAAHHVDDLFVSAAGDISGDPGGDGRAGWIHFNSDEHEWRLLLGTRELEDLFRAMSDDETAYDRLLGAAAAHQVELIDANATYDSDRVSGNGLAWARQIGAFNGVLMNAHDLQSFDEFDKDNERHKLFFSFVNSVAGAAATHPLAGAGSSFAISVLENASSPDVNDVLEANHDHRQLLTNTMNSAIALGYQHNGLVHSREIDELARGRAIVVEDGGMKIGPLNREELSRLLYWVGNDPKLDDLAGEAWDRAQLGLSLVDRDL
ncbi:MAG TPA: hypothetical protein VGQ84_05580 [Gaiellaceae bacterium]|jgi:hypothetical protein|nr:hypothetical protein [Gaiellaceae bacterium]